MAKHGRHSAGNGKGSFVGSQASGSNLNAERQPRHVRQPESFEVDSAKPALDRASVPSPALARSPESQYYGRNNYGSNATGPHARAVPVRGGMGKRIAMIAGFFVLGVVIALVAYALWFSTSLNNALAPSADTLKAVDQQLVSSPVNQPFYMLLLGSDSREGSGTSTNATEQGDQQRSDVIMLARIDAPNKQVTLVTVPRDTPYTMPDGSVQKINETYNVGGAALTIKAVSEVTGVPISHYANVHISELEAIVDSLGGIEVHVDRQLTVKDALTGETIV